MDKTKVIEGPFRTRRKASRRERLYQRSLRHVAQTGDTLEIAALKDRGVPEWARGARVERAGFFQWVVVATSHVGH